MKNILLASIVLTVFSITILTFQMSCTKTANAQTTSYVLLPATTSSLGGVSIGTGLSVTSSGVLSATIPSTGGLQQLNTIIYNDPNSSDVWLANLDGTNPRKVPIPLTSSQTLPGGYGIRLSPDGKIVVFTVAEGGKYNIYTCNIDGTNYKKIVSNGMVDGAY